MKKNNTEIKLAVTGGSWMKRGVGSIQSLMRGTLSKAKDEVLIAVYSINANKEFLQILEDLLIRGIRVSIIVNKFNNQHKTVQKILKKLSSKYNKFLLFSFEADDFEDLHAKLIVVDHSDALVGSANISERGFFRNHEMMVKVSGKTAYKIGVLIDILMKSSNTSRVKF